MLLLISNCAVIIVARIMVVVVLHSLFLGCALVDLDCAVIIVARIMVVIVLHA